MENTLQEYIENLKKELESYKNGDLQTQEYIDVIEDLNKWLEERKNEDSSHKSI